jgi:hypothetical protein
MASSLTPRLSQSSALVVVSEDVLSGLQKATSDAVTVYADASSGNIASALKAAMAIQSLRAYFDEPSIKAAVIALQDSPLGFRTDRDPSVKRKDKTGNYIPNVKYEYAVVKEAAIEALLRGLQLVGNQFNIIAGRFYCTREGFDFLIKQLPISDFSMSIGVPKMVQNGATVECSATWNQSKKDLTCSAVIPVKADQHSTADQLIGKATRKFLKRCYERMSGNIMPDDDTDPATLAAAPMAASPPPVSEAPADAPAIAPQSSGVGSSPVLSTSQLLKLNAAMEKRLTAVGRAAFTADVCTVFEVGQISNLPADQFNTVMGGLANETSVDRWNRGCASGSGELILTEDQLNQLTPQEEANTVESDDAQGALI